MDLFGVGGSEVLVLLFLAGVVLGPRRLARLARDVRHLMSQIRALTGNLAEQLNREIDLVEAAEAKAAQPTTADDGAAGADDKLPEAYRRFREDFPEEGQLENLSAEVGRRNGHGSQPDQPASPPDPGRLGDAGPPAAPPPSSSGQN